MLDWQQEKILVTGGGGFLGRRLIDRLQQAGVGEIRSFGRSPQPELEAAGAEVIQGDLQDAAAVNTACEDRSLVFHTAAKAGVWGSRQDYFGINVAGTENVIAACQQHAIQTLVYTSSPSVAYPPTEQIENVTEEIGYPERYLAFYPESKAMAEKAVLAANSTALRTVALRPHLIYGPGDPHLLPRVIARAKAGRLRIVGAGDNLVDLTYVDNAVEAHILAAENLRSSQSAAGKAFFISDGQPVKVWEWINDILGQLDVPAVKKQISYSKAYRIGAVLEGIYSCLPFLGEPPMTRFVAGQLAFSHYFDLAAARRDFNYEPVLKSDEALAKTVDWLKQR